VAVDEDQPCTPRYMAPGQFQSQAGNTQQEVQAGLQSGTPLAAVRAGRQLRSKSKSALPNVDELLIGGHLASRRTAAAPTPCALDHRKRRAPRGRDAVLGPNGLRYPNMNYMSWAPSRGLALWLRGRRGECRVRTTFPTTKITPAACNLLLSAVHDVVKQRRR
jgi:hypothetical protein